MSKIRGNKDVFQSNQFMLICEQPMTQAKVKKKCCKKHKKGKQCKRCPKRLDDK